MRPALRNCQMAVLGGMVCLVQTAPFSTAASQSQTRHDDLDAPNQGFFCKTARCLEDSPVHVRGTHRLRPESPRELNGVFCTLGSQVLRHFATSRSHQVARTSAAELTTATDRETGQPCSSQRPLHCTSAHRGCPRSGVEDDFELSSQLCV